MHIVIRKVLWSASAKSSFSTLQKALSDDLTLNVVLFTSSMEVASKYS